MRRIMVSMAALAAWGLLAAAPATAQAQISVDVHLSWRSGESGWRSAPLRYDRGGWIPAPRAPAPPVHRYRAPAPASRYRAPAVRIPPGHLPPPGSCKLWYVDRPPGHQPPPQPCWQLFRRYHGPGAVIIEGPRPRGGEWGPGYYQDRYHDDRYDPRYDERYYERHDDHPGRRGGRGRGNGNGRGRGG